MGPPLYRKRANPAAFSTSMSIMIILKTRNGKKFSINAKKIYSNSAGDQIKNVTLSCDIDQKTTRESLIDIDIESHGFVLYI